MYTPPPPPPQAVHRPAPEVNTSKTSENYRPQVEQSQTAKAERPYFPYATQKIASTSIFYNGGYLNRHTNRLHSRKQAKQRFKRNRR